jgi:hypothetical protein
MMRLGYKRAAEVLPSLLETANEIIDFHGSHGHSLKRAS